MAVWGGAREIYVTQTYRKIPVNTTSE